MDRPTVICHMLMALDGKIDGAFFSAPETMPALLLQKLKTLFGINRVLLAGGGVTNQAFAAAGLIDELSIVLAPTADGDSGSASLFETGGFSPAVPVAFALKAVEQIEDDTL